MMWLLFACAPTTDSIVPDRQGAAEVEEVPDDTGPSWTACEGDQAVRINEVLAANHHGILDADGETSDWIELYAPQAGVDLTGWTLGDAENAGWPLSGNLPPVTTLLVWASGKDSNVSQLHTDFSIAALASEVFLRSPEGCVADYVDVGRLYADISFGRTESGAWEYFLAPTPAAENTTESRPGFSATPLLDPPGGFYEAAEVSISGAQVRYTLDGAVPTSQSEAYGAPLDLEAGLQPVVVRAVAFEEGLWPSRVATSTYFEDLSLIESDVRIISLTAEPDDLFDPQTGIYEFGPDYERAYPHFGANFWELWERDVHVEYFEAGGERLFSQDAGIQIAGGYSRAFDQRNFELIARSGYGPEIFAGQVFDDEEISSFTRLYLRNGGDWCGTQLVDGIVQSLFRGEDGSRNPHADLPAYEPALVYINGEFWGLYEVKERLDESYAAAHHGADPDALDRVKVGWTRDANWEIEQGTWAAFDELEALRVGADLSQAAEWEAFDALVDLTNFATIQAAQGWIGNTDWWYNNIRMWRPTPDGEFRWMGYDFGHGYTSANYDHLGPTVVGSWPALPVADALENDAFRALFVNVHADFLNTSFRAESAAANVDELAAEVRPVMAMQRDRWCGGASMPAWEDSVAYARDFASQRGGFIEQHLVQHLNLGARVDLALAAEPAGGGQFALAAVEVKTGFSGTYYAGVPLTITAIPAEGYTFVAWNGAQYSTDPVLTLTPEGDVALTAVFEAE